MGATCSSCCCCGNGRQVNDLVDSDLQEKLLDDEHETKALGVDTDADYDEESKWRPLVLHGDSNAKRAWPRQASSLEMDEEEQEGEEEEEDASTSNSMHTRSSASTSSFSSIRRSWTTKRAAWDDEVLRQQRLVNDDQKAYEEGEQISSISIRSMDSDSYASSFERPSLETTSSELLFPEDIQSATNREEDYDEEEEAQDDQSNEDNIFYSEGARKSSSISRSASFLEAKRMFEHSSPNKSENAKPQRKGKNASSKKKR